MKYGLCKACKKYVESVKTPEVRYPNHCSEPQLYDVFGLGAKGYMTGIDIIACDFFEQHDVYCGDVLIFNKNGGVSYVDTNKRKKEKIYKLTDNSKNIKERPLDTKHIKYVRKHQQTHVAKNHKSNDSDFVCTSWCPF